MNAAVRLSHSIRFRGRSFLALAIAPLAPLDEWFAELDRLMARSPGFFADRPVVLDLAGLAGERLDVPHLVFEFARRDIRIMALEGADPANIEPGLPPMISGGRDTRAIEPSAPEDPVIIAPPPAPVPAATLIVDQPVRSGQSIVHPHGDIIVTAQVSSGAEVIAGGSVHIYGTLRGRAIAGTMGQSGARIFCQKLQAELLAIDGLYVTAESIDATLVGRPVHAWLRGDAMHMAALNLI